MKTEIECRLLEVNVNEFLTKLKNNNAKLIGDWLQMRYCYDFTPVQENSWIRLRTNGTETTLTINMVSDIKELEYVKVNDVVVTEYDAESSTYKAFIPADSEAAKVDIKTVSEYAKINIDSTEATNVISYTATTESDITYVYADVIAEDGSVKTYTIVLQKISTDSTLKELLKDGVHVDPQEDGNYLINVAENTTKVTLKAVTNNEYAKVAISTNEAELQETECEVILEEGKTTTINLTVTAQDGSISTYTATINKLSGNNELEYVKVNSENVTTYNEETKTYETFIPADSTTALIDIKAKSEYATVESGETSGKQLISYTATTDAEVTTIDVTVTAENGISEVYYIRLTKISKDNTIKEIYVDNVLVEADADGKCIAEVLETNTEAVVKVITNNEYATVQIETNEVEINKSEKTVTLSKEKLTNVLLTITSQNGEILQETLTIKKVSDDAGINAVLVNGIETKEYNEETKTYTAYIDADYDNSEVLVMANNNYATVVVDKVTGVGNAVATVDTENETTNVSVSVKSETGKVEKYTVTIIKKSADTSLAMIKVNDIEIVAPYEVDIKKLDNKVKVYVKATNDQAKVKIADEEAELSESTAILDIELNQDKIVIPVTVTAQNGKDKQSYNITLTRVSNDVAIKEILVNNEVVDLDTLEYIVKNVNTADIKVTTQSETAKVSIDDAEPTINVATATVDTKLTTVRTITVTAEDGTTKEYSLTLIKKVTIEGKITDENIVGEHIATITVYQTEDTRVEGDSTDPREVISTVQTNVDGSYEIVLEPGIYDVVFTKPGYLSHRITKIDITDGLGATLDDVNMIAGDVVEDGEIAIGDLVDIRDNFGDVTEGKEKYDLNGDGVINSLDRNILKANYGKLAESIEWVDPDMPEVTTFMVERTEATSEESTSTEEVVTKDTTNEAISNETVVEEVKDFILPMACEYRITSEYGMRIHPITGEQKKHTGIDISGVHHTEIYAVADGEVTFAGVQNGYGNCVEIKHVVNGVTIYSFYAHLSRIDVQVGDTVEQGNVIGLEGGDPETDPNPGSSTGHHLHFEIRTASGSRNDVNPNDYIKF